MLILMTVTIYFLNLYRFYLGVASYTWRTLVSKGARRETIIKMRLSGLSRVMRPLRR